MTDATSSRPTGRPTGALPKLLAGHSPSLRAATAPTAALPTSPRGEAFWSKASTGPPRTPATAPPGAPRLTPRPATSHPGMTSAGVQDLIRHLDEELRTQGLSDGQASFERLRVFRELFTHVVDMLPTYRPLLLAVQGEYDKLVGRLDAERRDSASVEGRLKTVKSESLAFVGESMGWFQQEMRRLQKQIHDLDASVKALQRSNDQLKKENGTLLERATTDRLQCKDSHEQNQDMLAYIRRLQATLDSLRAQVREAEGQVHSLTAKVKDKDLRIESIENQLKLQKAENQSMISPEAHNKTIEEQRQMEQRYGDLRLELEQKQKDYVSIVDTYLKAVNQTGKDIAVNAGARPLTPRPCWSRCRGLLDPGDDSTLDKATIAQELAQHLLVSSRNLLANYGLASAAQRSTVFQQYAKALPGAAGKDGIAPGDKEGSAGRPGLVRLRTQASLAPDPAEGGFLGAALQPSAGASAVALAGTRATQFAPADDPEEWLTATGDCAREMPEVFLKICKELDRVRNARFSRRKASEFIDSLVMLRLRRGAAQLVRPFAEFVLENLPNGMSADSGSKEKAAEFVFNLYAAVRHYSGEPDFLAYYLLLHGKITDVVVRDNKNLCAEVFKIFTTHFETDDGSSTITKQKLFFGLREVFQYKSQDAWTDVKNYFPVGPADAVVDYATLLVDDLYVLSPIVFGLRLQHLEEAVVFTERLEKVTLGLLEGGHGRLKHERVEAAFRDDPEFGLIHVEDFARAFELPAGKLTPVSEQEVKRFLSFLKSGEIYTMLFFPMLTDDDVSEGTLEDG